MIRTWVLGGTAPHNTMSGEQRNPMERKSRDALNRSPDTIQLTLLARRAYNSQSKVLGSRISSSVLASCRPHNARREMRKNEGKKKGLVRIGKGRKTGKKSN